MTKENKGISVRAVKPSLARRQSRAIRTFYVGLEEVHLPPKQTWSLKWSYKKQLQTLGEKITAYEQLAKPIAPDKSYPRKQKRGKKGNDDAQNSRGSKRDHLLRGQSAVFGANRPKFKRPADAAPHTSCCAMGGILWEINERSSGKLP